MNRSGLKGPKGPKLTKLVIKSDDPIMIGKLQLYIIKIDEKK